MLQLSEKRGDGGGGFTPASGCCTLFSLQLERFAGFPGAGSRPPPASPASWPRRSALPDRERGFWPWNPRLAERIAPDRDHFSPSRPRGVSLRTRGARSRTRGVWSRPRGARSKPPGAGKITLGAGNKPPGFSSLPRGARSKPPGFWKITLGARSAPRGAAKKTLGVWNKNPGSWSRPRGASSRNPRAANPIAGAASATPSREPASLSGTGETPEGLASSGARLQIRPPRPLDRRRSRAQTGRCRRPDEHLRLDDSAGLADRGSSNHVRVTGILFSKPGASYGHLGGYRYELVASKVEYLGAAASR